ncbi:ribosomal RNA large subunit methyltransferase I [Vigna unguiculata]|uniref:Ribosomal RNA large subunit methyltransferase I n=1 Tax=Vigna unguiculata TaxID=3917 RepID=A0A4D6LBY4_VIGUN|nr:ribosomal RNA large subunit methyltransferase I [Vigna unguiculata]
MKLQTLLMKSLSVCSLPASASTLQQIALHQPKGVAKVVLKKGKTQIFKDGNPMVYSGAVDRIIGRPPPKTGDVVLVADGTEKPIGWGLIDAAVEVRRRLGLPSVHTNAYRLINSEGDRLSGLIIDVFGDVAVVASSAAWVEKYKSEIEACLGKINYINHINWRPSVDILKEDGVNESELKEMPPSTCPERTKIVENGIVYTISLKGQKTGFYADQRENRQFISTISDGLKVLDLCCYSGGFALNAVRGGALNVTGIDTSLLALELAKENVLLNSIDPGRISFLKEDATEFMKGALSRNESWDIVIIDPPKLAPTKKVLHSASGMYRNLNSLAMQLTKRGGFLMTCSCSGAVTQSGIFLRILQGAASMAGRRITVLRQSGAACDHPIDPSYPEGAYLTNILVRVS